MSNGKRMIVHVRLVEVHDSACQIYGKHMIRAAHVKFAVGTRLMHVKVVVGA